MEETEFENLKKTLKVLKFLDYTEDDIQRVLKIEKKKLKKL